MATTTPESLMTSVATLFEDEDPPARPRFAAQRAAAARIAHLPERMLLNRARCEGEAHRRTESEEQEALPLSL